MRASHSSYTSGQKRTPRDTGSHADLRIWGGFFLGTGAALVVHITSGVSLPTALAVAGAIILSSGGILWQRLSRRKRLWLILRVRAGVIAGTAATVVYDCAKYILAFLDPSPYNPFELMRVFGRLLTGSSQTTLGIYLVGTAFHVTNGVSFATAFCLLVRKPSVLAGVAWALFLELFQLALYPGWLDIRFYAEFAQISALSHVAYGIVLGTLASNLLDRPPVAR